MTKTMLNGLDKLLASINGNKIAFIGIPITAIVAWWFSSVNEYIKQVPINSTRIESLELRVEENTLNATRALDRSERATMEYRAWDKETRERQASWDNERWMEQRKTNGEIIGKLKDIDAAIRAKP